MGMVGEGIRGVEARRLRVWSGQRRTPEWKLGGTPEWKLGEWKMWFLNCFCVSAGEVANHQLQECGSSAGANDTSL